MKKVMAIIFILFGQSTFAKNYAEMFDIVFRNKLYYSSYVFLKKAVEKDLKVDPKKVAVVLDTIHPSVFIHDEDLDEFIAKKSQIDFPVAIRRFFLNDFKTAKKKLRKLRKNSSMKLESNYILGLISLTKNKLKRASIYFKRCIRESLKKKSNTLKAESYIAILKNRCIQQLARIKFSKKKFKKAIKIYDYVKKDDYIWPKFLIDKAWAYYWMGETERALGSVMSYKAPLLRRFMVPEANYLRGLIYYELCYFEKSENIYKEFNKTTWRFRNAAKTASRNRLLKLILAKKEPRSEEDKFLYFYLKGFKQDLRFFTFKKSYNSISKEIKKLARIKSLRQAKKFLNSLYFYKKAIKKDFQDFLKNLSEDYYLQISQMRNAFVKLNLMISLNKRKKLAKGEDTQFDDEFLEKSLSNISDIDEKFIWDFRGGFWADELGDYAVALQNRCKS